MESVWFWRLYRLARIQRCYTKQPDKQAFQNKVFCKHTEIDLVSSSNIVLHIKNEDCDGFFTPIYRHTDLITYLECVTKDYYSFVCRDRDTAESDMEIILRSLEREKSPKASQNIARMWQSTSCLSQFQMTGDPAQIGLDAYPSDEASVARLRRFILKYVSGALHAYRQNAQIKNNAWQTAGANRTMGVEALAKLLGLSDMIPHAEYCVLEVEGKHRCFGVFMECAQGEDITQITKSRRQSVLSPMLQRELNKLHMLDTIVGEIDHCPENYHLVIENAQAQRIHVFDNNSARNFSVFWNVSFETILKCAPFVDADGYINRPYIDAHLASRMMDISFRDLKHILSPYLATLPIISLFVRVKRLRKAIRKSLAAGSVSMKAHNEWNEETLQEELYRLDAKTYLHSFLNDCVHI